MAMELQQNNKADYKALQIQIFVDAVDISRKNMKKHKDDENEFEYWKTNFEICEGYLKRLRQ